MQESALRIWCVAVSCRDCQHVCRLHRKTISAHGAGLIELASFSPSCYNFVYIVLVIVVKAVKLCHYLRKRGAFGNFFVVCPTSAVDPTDHYVITSAHFFIFIRLDFNKFIILSWSVVCLFHLPRHCIIFLLFRLSSISSARLPDISATSISVSVF